MHTDAGNIQRQRNGHCFNRAEITVLDSFREAIFVGQCIEVFAEVTHVPAVRRRRDAEDVGLVEMLEHGLVSVRKAMVSLVDDDVVEVIRRKLREALWALQALDGADGHAVPAIKAGFLSLLDGASEPSRFF